MEHYGPHGYAQGPVQPPKKRRPWLWFVVGGVIVLPVVFLVATLTVNGATKINRIVSIADGVPEPDWKLVTDHKPRNDITCIPFDQSCHVLFRVWEAPEQVDLQELVDATGYDLEVGTVYRPDCADGYEERIRTRICVDDREVRLDMND